MPQEKKRKRHYLDYGILLPYLFLVTFGIVMVYSSTSYLQYLSTDTLIYGGPASYARNQAIFLGLSFVLMAIIYKMKTNFFKQKRLMGFLLAAMLVLLILTRFTSLGKEINGARGWLNLFGFSIQPAEYLKLLIIWYLSFIFSRRQKTIAADFWQAAGFPVGLVALYIGFVLIQPDVGGAVILSLIALTVILVSGIHYRWFEVLFVGGVFSAALGIEVILLFGKHIPFIKNYIYDRFAVFRNPFIDVTDKGHQLAHSYYAIHNGGWWGLGLGNSIEKKGFLPEAHTDFVFSILIEELGVVAAILILALLFFMIIRILLVGIRSNNPFNSMMMMGIATLFTVQIFVNLGGVLGLIPMTGVTFPFISQGGSSLLMLSLAVGFALNISADERRQKELTLGRDDVRLVLVNE